MRQLSYAFSFCLVVIVELVVKSASHDRYSLGGEKLDFRSRFM